LSFLFTDNLLYQRFEARIGAERVEQGINFEFPGEAVALLDSFGQPGERLFLVTRSNASFHELRGWDVLAAGDFRV
jgi:hypothetical protein